MIFDTLKKLAEISHKIGQDQEKIVIKLKKLEAGQEDMIIRVLTQIRPLMIQAMVENYNNSGIQTKTGGLLAALQNPVVTISPRGIRITVSGHEKQAAALNFGWVLGQGGRRLKANIKKSGVSVAGFTHIGARKFLFLTESQVAFFQETFNRLYQAEVDKV